MSNENKEKKDENILPEGVFDNKPCQYRVACRNCYGDRFAYCLLMGEKCKNKSYGHDGEGNTIEFCRRPF